VDDGALWKTPTINESVLRGGPMTPGISATALAAAVVRLRAAGCVFAEEEAAVLGEAAAGDTALATLVARRALGEPLEQVVGYADFCGVRVRLRPGVFVPRVRSELLVREATEKARKNADGAGRNARPIVVDLCCGSGALGLAVRHQVPTTDLYAADLDPAAVACARDNLGAHVYQGDLYEALPTQLRGRIAILLANVPYVATGHIPLLPAEARDHEPHTALDGGADGLEIFRAVAAGAQQWLADGGILLCEITEAQEEEAIRAVRAAGLDAEVIRDDDLEARVIRGLKSVGGVR
jgi:release factor glutamine methyltransferase